MVIARILYPYKLAVMGLVADRKRIMLEKLYHCTIPLLCLVLIGSIVVLSTSMVHAAQSDRDLYFVSLEKRLKTDGFNAAKIDALYQRPDITFQTRNVSLFFILRKGKMDHSHYTDPKSIQKAKEAVLRENLYVMRVSIDQYFADKGFYPADLYVLADESYIRKIPDDPITQSPDTWVTTQSEFDDRDISTEPGIIDVHSGADGVGQDGTSYADW